MKRWLLFLVMPLLILKVLQFLSLFGLNLFQINEGDFVGLIVAFIVFFCGGIAILHWAPNKKPVLAYSLAALNVFLLFYVGIVTEGRVFDFMGEKSIIEFSILEESIKAAGLLLGVYGAVGSEKEKKENKIEVVDVKNS